MDRLNKALLKVLQFFLGKIARDIMPANATAWHMNREFARHKATYLRFIHARPYLVLWVMVEYIWEENDGQYGNFAFFPLQSNVSQREASARVIFNRAEKEARLAIEGKEPDNVG